MMTDPTPNTQGPPLPNNVRPRCIYPTPIPTCTHDTDPTPNTQICTMTDRTLFRTMVSSPHTDPSQTGVCVTNEVRSLVAPLFSQESARTEHDANCLDQTCGQNVPNSETVSVGKLHMSFTFGTNRQVSPPAHFPQPQEALRNVARFL